MPSCFQHSSSLIFTLPVHVLCLVQAHLFPWPHWHKQHTWNHMESPWTHHNGLARTHPTTVVGPPHDFDTYNVFEALICSASVKSPLVATLRSFMLICGPMPVATKHSRSTCQSLHWAKAPRLQLQHWVDKDWVEEWASNQKNAKTSPERNQRKRTTKNI